MFEIEMKFRVEDQDGLIDRIAAEGGVFVSKKVNEDTYYNHPCRDFAETGEAFRIRREDGIPLITYKAPKLSGKGASGSKGSSAIEQVKAREELEWRLDPGDADGTSTQRLLTHLGFRQVAVVRKDRQTYRLGADESPITVTVDTVDSVGLYSEIECVLPTNEPSDADITSARERVVELANRLELHEIESRSYLRMLLAKNEPA